MRDTSDIADISRDTVPWLAQKNERSGEWKELCRCMCLIFCKEIVGQLKNGGLDRTSDPILAKITLLSRLFLGG